MGYGMAMKGVVLGLLMVLGTVAGVQPSKVARAVPAIFVLGDSTLDVGNNNYLPGKDVPRANLPFYGIDFPGGPRPTGRFSNGYNMADFVAKTLGFERSPSAYLSLKARNNVARSALLKGVSYASAGAGILDSTNAGKNIPLSKQVRYFESTKAAMVAKAGSDVVSDLLARSFFLLSIGSNDLFQSKIQSKDVAALFNSLTSNYSAAITDLYRMGARKFGIISVGAVGCVPRVRVLNATGACNDGMNQLAAAFAGALKSHLAAVAPKLPGLAYSLSDTFAYSQASPQAAGFVSADSACCGSGRLGAGGRCQPNATLCTNRDEYLFWDSVHSTQKAAELGAQALYDGPSHFTAPLSFKQLAQKY